MINLQTYTLFEHESVSYVQLGWSQDDTRIEQLEKLNNSCGAELLHLGRHQLRASKYVGLIRVDDTAIQILPKIDYTSEENGFSSDSNRNVSASANLMSMLTYANNMRIHPQDSALLRERRGNWFEWLTFLFARELIRQLRLGVDKTYISREDALPLLRGKWLISKQFAHHPMLLDRFEVRYTDYIADTTLNQVLAAAVNHLLRLTDDAGNYRLLLSARNILIGAGCEDAPISRGFHHAIHFTRLNDRFRTAYQLADLFLRGSVFNFSVGRQDVTAFVFNMNVLFEQFITNFLIRHRDDIFSNLPGRVRVISQGNKENIHFLMQYQPLHRDIFRLKPDVLVYEGSQLAVIIDMKYKKLNIKKRNLNLQESDSYQMFAYASTFACDQVQLIYPQPGQNPIHALYQVRNQAIDLRVDSINLHQPLDQPDVLIGDFKQMFGFLKKEVHDAQI
jgi:5-methylcytosine-specific restriction enzyme subunit McrC